MCIIPKYITQSMKKSSCTNCTYITHVAHFSKLIYYGNQIYCGATSRSSRFGGYQVLSIITVTKINGEMVATYKLCDGAKLFIAIGEYVGVSLSVMIIRVGID